MYSESSIRVTFRDPRKISGAHSPLQLHNTATYLSLTTMVSSTRLIWCLMGGILTLSIQLFILSLSSLPSLPATTTSASLAQERPPQPPLVRQVEVPPPSGKRFHYIFTTECKTTQEDYAAYAFFYHMYLLNTTAEVTRIATGCSKLQAAKLQGIFNKEVRTLSDRFHFHATPDYSFAHAGEPDEARHDFFNAPMGLKHWFDKGLQFQAHRQRWEDVIFVVLDADELVLRPFTDDYTNEDVVWHPHDRLHTRIEHGKPMAQIYLIQSHWANSLNVDALLKATGAPSPLRTWTSNDILNHYQAGPPYLATGRDMYAIVSKWAAFVVEVYRQTGSPMSDMLAYAVAAGHLNLKHQLVWSFMVGNVAVKEEGWSSIDALPDAQVCQRPKVAPYVLHYCQRYMLGPYIFTKYVMPSDMLTCEHPLLAVPGTSLLNSGYTRATPPNGKVYDIVPERRKRHAYMLCEMMGRLNQVAVFWKQRNCDGKANYKATFRFPAMTEDEQDLYDIGAY